MSRSWNSGLVNMLAGEEITRCHLIELVCPYVDVGTVRLTDHDVDLVLTDVSPSETFSHDAGFAVTRYRYDDKGQPAGLDIELPITGDGPIYAEHIRKGAWRKATVKVWLTNFTTPANREQIFEGFIGRVDFNEHLDASVQLLTKADSLRDVVLLTIEPKCSYTFCGTRCGLSAVTYTVSGTVATVTSNSAFTVTITNPNGYDFTRGLASFTSGNNNGGVEHIRLWTSGSALVETADEFPFDIQVGDAVDLLAGCKQNREACVAYNNVDRFFGMDFIPE